MKEIPVTAKDKAGKVIGTGKCKLYDAGGEVIKDIQSSPEKAAEIVARLNAQIKTDEMNKLRKPAGALSLGSLVKKAPAEAQEKIKDILKKAGIKVE